MSLYEKCNVLFESAITQRVIINWQLIVSDILIDLIKIVKWKTILDFCFIVIFILFFIILIYKTINSTFFSLCSQLIQLKVCAQRTAVAARRRASLEVKLVEKSSDKLCTSKSAK